MTNLLKHLSAILTFLVCISITERANAAFIYAPTLSGLGTFEDTLTGDIWLRLDNFPTLTVGQQLQAIEGTGFKLASAQEVILLLTTNGYFANPWGIFPQVLGMPTWQWYIGAIAIEDQERFGAVYTHFPNTYWTINTSGLGLFSDNTLNTIPIGLWAIYRPETVSSGDGDPVDSPGAIALMLTGLLVIFSARKGNLDVST